MDSRGNLWWADLGGAAVLDWPTPEELEAAWKKVG
jgi:hypothetical protein